MQSYINIELYNILYIQKLYKEYIPFKTTAHEILKGKNNCIYIYIRRRIYNIVFFIYIILNHLKRTTRDKLFLTKGLSLNAIKYGAIKFCILSKLE